jgi:hypothetical protein
VKSDSQYGRTSERNALFDEALEAGVTNLIISAPTRQRSQALELIGAFGDTYLH